MKIFFNCLIGLLFLSMIFEACKEKETLKPAEDFTSQILTDYSNLVVLNGYQELELWSSKLHNQLVQFTNNPSKISFEACKKDWKDTRKVWEESEACLFGPVSTSSIDPRIDTWPVDFNRFDTILKSKVIFSQSYIDNLEESLKGFHSIEYLLWGVGGNKTFDLVTSRELEFLIALSENLNTLTKELRNAWELQGGNYLSEFVNAGSGSSLYPTKRAAFEEMVNAMIGVCDEVANGKIGEVASTLDSMKEESPFAKNSVTDFTNNIQGVMNGYLSKNSTTDGKGLEDFVRQHNLSLDASIKQKHNEAIQSLNNITVPFGEAIFKQPIQVQGAIDAINRLKLELENGLLPLVQLYVQ